MTEVYENENQVFDSLHNRRGRKAAKWTSFMLLVGITYAAFAFGLILTVARIDGEFVGEV